MIFLDRSHLDCKWTVSGRVCEDRAPFSCATHEDDRMEKLIIADGPLNRSARKNKLIFTCGPIKSPAHENSHPTFNPSSPPHTHSHRYLLTLSDPIPHPLLPSPSPPHTPLPIRFLHSLLPLPIALLLPFLPSPGDGGLG